MPVSEAQKKASVKYLEKLDEVRIRMPKGNKAVIQAHAEARGESTNAFIGRAIQEAMERDASGDPQEDKIVVPVTQATIREWEDAASIAQLPLHEFIIKAVEEAIDWVVSPELIEEVSLPSDAIKTAQEAAQAAGEGLTQFVARAVESQARVDQIGRESRRR